MAIAVDAAVIVTMHMLSLVPTIREPLNIDPHPYFRLQ